MSSHMCFVVMNSDDYDSPAFVFESEDDAQKYRSRAKRATFVVCVRYEAAGFYDRMEKEGR